MEENGVRVAETKEGCVLVYTEGGRREGGKLDFQGGGNHGKHCATLRNIAQHCVRFCNRKRTKKREPAEKYKVYEKQEVSYIQTLHF